MSYNPLKVSLENIVPLTYARDHFSQIVSEVQQDKLFVLTKGGKPAVAIIDVKYLEDITGGQVQKEDIKEEIKKAPEKVGLPPMVEHPSPPPPMPKVEPKPIPKPAGFAAPSFASSDAKAMEDKKATEDKPQPPKPISPPAQPKPVTPPTPPPPPPIPAPKTASPPAEPAGEAAREPKKEEPLVMPEQKPFDSAQGKPAPIPNKPLTTLPPVNNQNDIDVQFSPDTDELDKKAQDAKTPDSKKIAPDDENSPAQYAGEKPAGKEEPEPEDMALD